MLQDGLKRYMPVHPTTTPKRLRQSRRLQIGTFKLKRAIIRLVYCRKGHDFQKTASAVNAVVEQCSRCHTTRFRVMRRLKIKLWLTIQ